MRMTSNGTGELLISNTLLSAESILLLTDSVTVAGVCLPVDELSLYRH